MAGKIILHSGQSLAKTVDTDARLLRSLTGKRTPRVGYIPSCSDPRRRWFEEVRAYYAKAGAGETLFFDPCEEHSPEETDKILKCDVLHLCGGVVGAFRQRLADSGFDRCLASFSERGGVLLGVSAGAMVLGRTFELARVFGEKCATDGLGLFEFEIFPHRVEMATRRGAVRDFARRTGRDVWALDDGDVVVLNGAKLTTVGTPELITGTEARV